MIENVELTNFISHRGTALQLEDGVNVFIGANGSGKSSVVDAVTYALYGEHTRDAAKNILRRGAAGGAVSVKFGIGGKEYLAERRLGKGGRLESATLRELAPNPRLIVAGERRQYDESMSEEVAKAFGLDYEKMKVAAIVQQGELDAIIRYKPKELKELINSLIGIDKLDLAYQNMYKALDGFRLKLRTECMNYDDQSIGALRTEIEETRTKQEEATRLAREISDRLAKYEDERRKLEEELGILEPLRAKKGELEERKRELVRYVSRRTSELEAEAKTLREVIQKARGYLPAMAAKGSVERQMRTVEKRLQDLRHARTGLVADLRSAGGAGERVEKLKEEVERSRSKIRKLAGKIRNVRVEIAKLKSVKIPTRETQEQLRSKLRQAETSEGNLRDTLTEIGATLGNYKTIQEKGVCPTCGSTVEEINLDAKLKAKHKEHLEAKSRHEAASLEKDSVERLLDMRKKYDDAQTKLREQTGILKEHVSDLGAEREDLRSKQEETRAKLAEARKAPRLEAKRKSVESEISKLERNERSIRQKQSFVVEAETFLRSNEIESKADVEKLGRKLKEIQLKVSSVPRDKDVQTFEKLVVDDHSSDLVQKVTELIKEVSQYDEDSYQQRKRRLEEEIRPKIAELTKTGGGYSLQESESHERLSKLSEALVKLEDATSYIRLFERIRSDVYNRDGVLATSLRSWALKELSRNASEYIRSFGIGLSELKLEERKHDVDIECYSAYGMADVKSMSGGEGVAIALALRFAMARLMGRGMVDFVVLDEPTTHLDEERKRSLVRLVTEFNSDERRTSLNQIIVITHDRAIFEDSEVNAVFQFEKTPDGTAVAKS